MVGIVIVSHSARIAEGVVELASQMGGAEVAVAAAGGVDDPDDPIGTDPFAIKTAIEAVWSPDGVLVLMDLGSAVMNAETALDFLEDPVDPARVLLCEAPLVEGAVAAAATAGTGATLEQVAEEARSGLLPKMAHLSSDPPAGESTASDVVVEVTIPNRLGLHLRPAARLVELAAGFDATVHIANLTTGAGPSPAGSISRVSALGVRRGHVIEVRAGGRQADQAVRAIGEMVASLEDPDEVRTTTAPKPADGRISGVGGAPGVAVGIARRLTAPALVVPDRVSQGSAAEKTRLGSAVAEAGKDIDAQAAAVGGEEAGIFVAHRLLLDELATAAEDVLDGSSTAETAWRAAVEDAAAGFRGLDEAYQAGRAVDVEAVGTQVTAHLLGVRPFGRMDQTGVLVADDLTPGETATLDPELVKGIVTAGGGANSHSAIIARALGVPAVLGIGPVRIPEEAIVLVDGDNGMVTIDPDADEVAAVERQIRENSERRAVARETAPVPVTLDGVHIHIAANVGSVADARRAAGAGAEGIGLLRTEFLFLNRTQAPDQAEQEDVYRRIAEEIGRDRPLVIRTLDVGGDKPMPFVDRPSESNPFLGVRGLRLGLAEPELAMTQLRAVMAVAVDHRIRLMFPMVATTDDWEAARSMVAEAAEPYGGVPADFQLGVMVEVPALALLADRFAPVVDFFSIGTNDLTQYVLASERGHPELSHLADALHPAVLALIERTCRAAEPLGRWVGVCGEIASDPAAIPLLIGLGVTELSMSPLAIPGAKGVVPRVDTGVAREMATEALGAKTAAEVRSLAQGFFL